MPAWAQIPFEHVKNQELLILCAYGSFLIKFENWAKNSPDGTGN